MWKRSLMTQGAKENLQSKQRKDGSASNESQDTARAPAEKLTTSALAAGVVPFAPRWAFMAEERPFKALVFHIIYYTQVSLIKLLFIL